jgi:hypothetical protein
MKFCGNMKLWHVESHQNYRRLHLKWFHHPYHNIIVDDGYIISKLKNEFIFWKKIIIRFINVETNLSIQYSIYLKPIWQYDVSYHIWWK